MKIFDDHKSTIKPFLEGEYMIIPPKIDRMITQTELEQIADKYTVGEIPDIQYIELSVFNGTPMKPFTAAQMTLFITTIKLLRENGIQISLRLPYKNGEYTKLEDRPGRIQAIYQEIPK